MLLQRKRMMTLLSAIMYPVLLLLMIRLSSFPGGNLVAFIDFLTDEVSAHPFHLSWNSHTLPVCFIFTVAYVVIWFLIITSLKNTRYGEEHGSAKWVSASSLGRKLKARWTRKDRKAHRAELKEVAGETEMERRKRKGELRRRNRDDLYRQNILFSDKVRVAMDTTCENINTLILGGAGRMKSRGFIMPNIMQMNSNIVCTDPKGEILKKTGHLLKQNGYDVRVLDLVEHYRSHGYNPFPYFRSDDDILLFVNNMWGAMEEKPLQRVNRSGMTRQRI